MSRKPIKPVMSKIVLQTKKKHFYNHDDRVSRMDDNTMESSGSRLRVQFKNQSRPARDRTRNFEMAIKDQIDGDVIMSSSKNNSSNNNNRKASHARAWMNRPYTINNKAFHDPVNGSNWFRISIPYGGKYDKDFIINNLLSSIAPLTFIPIMYKVIGRDAIFFIDDQKTASKLLSIDRKITTPDNFKISIRVHPGYPHSQIDDTLKEKLRLAMAKRYVPETNALDLSCLHHDSDLVTDYFCPLFRPQILTTVMEIISQAIPNLEALNMENNKLTTIDRLNTLPTKFTNLKILYIGDNKIKDMHQMDVIKKLKLEELRLAGNPVCNKYRNRHDDYISDVRKRFPKLLRLDGAELPKPIVFDVADEGMKLPPSQRIFTANAKAQEIANQFMQQYFTIYDSDSRQSLLVAYHEQAVFSLAVTHNPTIHKFNLYLPYNRNLFRTNDTARRKKLLKQGRLPVVTLISELPKTQHYPNTFTMDIGLVTDKMMVITVTGLFKELGTKDEPIRYFDRTFIIVPEGTGYCIKNEQLQLLLPTHAQEKQITDGPTLTFASEAAAVAAAAASSSSSSSSQSAATLNTPALSTANEPSDDIKQQMTMTLSQQTNMNLEWSLKCLQEVQWNFDTAVAAFNEFFQRGQIPPVAFNK